MLPLPIHPLQQAQSTQGQVCRELFSLEPQQGWSGSVKLPVSHINTRSLGNNPRLSVTWNTSYANNKLKVTKTTKCETRFKDLVAILSSLLFRQNASKAFGSSERCPEMVADFVTDNDKQSKGLISATGGEGKLPPATGKSRSDFPVKTLLPLPVEPASSSSRKCISEEEGKEFEWVKKAEAEDCHWESRCLQDLWPHALFPCPLQLTDTPIYSGNDRRKQISYPRICCRS